MDLRPLLIPRVLLAAVLVAVPLAGPLRAEVENSQARAVGAFDRIHLTGAFTTFVTAGAQRQKLVITGARDAVSDVTTEVRDRTLEIGQRDGHTSMSEPTLSIAVPLLRGIENTGVGTTKITGLSGGDLALANSGAATVEATGRAANLSITLDGVGKIDTTSLFARNVTVTNNGVGGVYVRASGTLSASVNGVGEIRYTGNPTHVDSQVNGVGRISKI
jgi:hypothetical protein